MTVHLECKVRTWLKHRMHSGIAIVIVSTPFPRSISHDTLVFVLWPLSPSRCSLRFRPCVLSLCRKSRSGETVFYGVAPGGMGESRVPKLAGTFQRGRKSPLVSEAVSRPECAGALSPMNARGASCHPSTSIVSSISSTMISQIRLCIQCLPLSSPCTSGVTPLAYVRPERFRPRSPPSPLMACSMLPASMPGLGWIWGNSH